MMKRLCSSSVQYSLRLVRTYFLRVCFVSTGVDGCCCCCWDAGLEGSDGGFSGSGSVGVGVLDLMGGDRVDVSVGLSGCDGESGEDGFSVGEWLLLLLLLLSASEGDVEGGCCCCWLSDDIRRN